MRKNVLDYDDVMNTQRQAIYEERNKVLDDKNLTEIIQDMVDDIVDRNVDQYCSEQLSTEDWDRKGLLHWLKGLTGKEEHSDLDDIQDADELYETIHKFLEDVYKEKLTDSQKKLLKN